MAHDNYRVSKTTIEIGRKVDLPSFSDGLAKKEKKGVPTHK